MEQTDKKQRPRIENGRTLTQWMAYALWANDIIPADAGFYAIASECELDAEQRFNHSPECAEFDRKYEHLSARYC